MVLGACGGIGRQLVELARAHDIAVMEHLSDRIAVGVRISASDNSRVFCVPFTSIEIQRGCPCVALGS